MSASAPRDHPLPVSVLTGLLLAPPTAYLAISYGYLAAWHGDLWLWNTVVHENGRLTLLGSLFYFDHFVALVPMVTLFALSAVTGVH